MHTNATSVKLLLLSLFSHSYYILSAGMLPVSSSSYRMFYSNLLQFLVISPNIPSCKRQAYKSARVESEYKFIECFKLL